MMTRNFFKPERIDNSYLRGSENLGPSKADRSGNFFSGKIFSELDPQYDQHLGNGFSLRRLYGPGSGNPA